VSLQALLVAGELWSSATRKQQELLWELGDINIGVGTLQATNTRVYEAVEPTVTKLREWVQDQPTCMDETPWPVLGVKEWLWVSAEEKVCFMQGIPARVELDQQLGLSLTALSAAMTSVCTTATQQDPNRNVWHICGVTSKKWQVGSCLQPSLGTRVLD